MAAETRTIYDRTAAEFASRVDRLIDTGRYRRGQLFLEAASATVPSGGTILDYGCGPGRISALLARRGFRVRGFDPSAAMIAAAREQPLEGAQVEFQCLQTVGSLSLPPGCCDAVVCSSVLEYVPEPVDLLLEFHGALRPAGTLIISFANRRSLSRAVFQRRNLHLPDQKHLWTWREFRRLLAEAQFQPVREPRYFESALDRFGFGFLSASAWTGTLGLVVARRQEP
jgi:SAM-dependent methyltransferase